MARRKPGEAVPPRSVADAADKSWWMFKHFNPGSAAEPRIAYVMGYRRAVADMVVDSFEFGGWDILTRRLLEVFEDLAIEREAVRISTAAAARENSEDDF
jgi:hypothetical protein